LKGPEHYVHDLFQQAGDRMWTPADWAWAGGLNAVRTTLIHGRAVVASLAAKCDPERAEDRMATRGVRNAFVPPTALSSDMIAWGRDAFENI
jgi:acetyl-CoA synthetase